MASQKSAQEAAPAQGEPPALTADEKTPTIYGVTLGELVARYTRELEAKQNQATADAAKITDLMIKLNSVVLEKGQMGLLIEELRPYRTLTRRADGSIRLPIELDQDTASRYLAQAEDAREDPQEYIQRQLSEALLAYSNA